MDLRSYVLFHSSTISLQMRRGVSGRMEENGGGRFGFRGGRDEESRDSGWGDEGNRRANGRNNGIGGWGEERRGGGQEDNRRMTGDRDRLDRGGGGKILHLLRKEHKSNLL